MQYVTLCDWLLSLGIRLSRFIHVVDVSVFHCFFLSLHSITLCGYVTFV